MRPVIEVVDVVLVNVEIWVSDRKGEPIHGLTKADFEVLEDGQPMVISHFAEVGDGPESGSATTTLTPAGGPEAVAAPPIGDPPHLVIYFDKMHMGATSVRRVAADVREFLAEGQVPASRVAIVEQGIDLDLQADFGSTPEQLDAAMERIAETVPVAGGHFASKLALARMQQNWEYARSLRSPCRIMANLTKAELGSRVSELRHHFAITLGNLNATARFLAGLPGPKILVLVSDSLEMHPGEDLLRFAKNVCPNERDLHELSLLGDAVDQRQALLDFALSANTNRVTFYPLQASGLIASSVTGAENRAFDTTALRGVDQTLRRVQQAGLLSLAEETGGVATVNRNSFRKPLERIARDVKSYYSLAYVPPHAGGGGSHSIKVRVRAPEARVRHRLGYRDKSPAEIRDERLDGAIAFGIMDNPLAVRLAAGEIEKGSDGRFGIPLHVLVPCDRIIFLPLGDQQTAELEVIVRAREAASGELVELTELMQLRLPGDGSNVCDMTVDLALPEGVFVLGVALRDLVTGETSVVSTTVAIQDSDAGQLGT